MTLNPDPYASVVVDEMLNGVHRLNLDRAATNRAIGAAFTLIPPSVRAATAHVVVALVRLGAPPMQVERAIIEIGEALAAVAPSIVDGTARVVVVTLPCNVLVCDLVASIGHVSAVLLERPPLGAMGDRGTRAPQPLGARRRPPSR